MNSDLEVLNKNFRKFVIDVSLPKSFRKMNIKDIEECKDYLKIYPQKASDFFWFKNSKVTIPGIECDYCHECFCHPDKMFYHCTSLDHKSHDYCENCFDKLEILPSNCEIFEYDNLYEIFRSYYEDFHKEKGENLDLTKQFYQLLNSNFNKR